MVDTVTFPFQTLAAEIAGDPDEIRTSVPRKAGVFRIFDIHDNLILLEKTSNLARRIERFYADEREARALDLREITGRIEFCPTDSPFETLYLLHSERRRRFPATYHRMRTFPRYHLLKINPRQRFPRIYAARQVKAGVRYFGPFESRAELDRMKTTLERTFKLRPCEYNIRGDDPYPDCLYFQMRTCSRPCNGDIDRGGYLRDVEDAITFLTGRDDLLREPLLGEMKRLSEETRFEDAARIRKRLEGIERGRKDHRETYVDLWRFDFVVVMESGSTRRRKVAFVQGGRIVTIQDHETAGLAASLAESLGALATGPLPEDSPGSRYEDFCLVSHFIAHPLKAVQVVPLADPGKTIETVVAKIEHDRTEATRKRAAEKAKEPGGPEIA